MYRNLAVGRCDPPARTHAYGVHVFYDNAPSGDNAEYVD